MTPSTNKWASSSDARHKKPEFKAYTTCTPPRKKSRWVRTVALIFAAWLVANLVPDYIYGLIPNLGNAARTGNTTVLKWLLKHPGVNINSTNNEGDTALALAAGKGQPERLKKLLTHPDINVNTVNSQGMRPLNSASQQQALECSELLRQAGARELPEFVPAH